MTLYSKIKWVLGVLLVFVLILGTNLIDRNNFRSVRNSVETIYEDRLVAKDLLYEFSLLIHEKEVAAVASDTDFFEKRNTQNNSEVEQLLAKYSDTNFTAKEETVFSRLKEDLDDLNKKEAAGIKDIAAYKTKILDVKEKLNDLFKIQLAEGKSQMLLSKEVFKEVELYTQMEIYMLIVLAVIIQIIILYKPKEVTDPNLD